MTAKKVQTPKPPVFDAEHEKAKVAFKAVDAEKTVQAAGAIAILERRAAATKEIELSDGDMVPIHTRLSRAKMAECADLFQFIANNKDTASDEEMITASNKLIGHVLIVDGMTPEEIGGWLCQNPDKFTNEDAEKIISEFGEALLDEKKRREAMTPFRPK